MGRREVEMMGVVPTPPPYWLFDRMLSNAPHSERCRDCRSVSDPEFRKMCEEFEREVVRPGAPRFPENDRVK